MWLYLLVFGLLGIGAYLLLIAKPRGLWPFPPIFLHPFERALKLEKKGAGQRTPAGAPVFGEVTLSNAALLAIDAGLVRTFEKAYCAGYSDSREFNALEARNYKICIFKSERAPKSQTPVFRVPAAQYKGTEYDQGGYVFAGGQMIATGEPYGNILALPAPIDDAIDLGHLSNGAEFEAEHVVLSWYDGKRYEETKTHGSGKGHPIIPACAPTEKKELNAARETLGFVAKRAGQTHDLATIERLAINNRNAREFETCLPVIERLSDKYRRLKKGG